VTIRSRYTYGSAVACSERLEGAGLELAKQYSAVVLDPCVGQELSRHRLLLVSEAFARSVRNNTLAEFGAQGIRMGGFAVLARVLTPSDFGSLRARASTSALHTRAGA